MVLITVVIVLAAVGTGACGGDDASPINPIQPTAIGGADPSTPPTNLVAPVDPMSVSLVGVINPFGVVRSSLDSLTIGHPGIDLPSAIGTPLLAVAAGRIVSRGPENDGLPGEVIRLLVAEGTDPGTGWVFLYEHVNLAPGLDVGSNVQQGQAIATSSLMASFGNHLELAWAFNDYTFHQNQTCWVTQLGGGARAVFQSHFDNVLRTDQRFVNGWTTVTFEERFPFRALLDPARFPDGAALCYPPGTDVREQP